MSRAIPWLAAVGVVLVAIGAIGWVWSEDVLPPAVFTSQGVACLLGAAVLELRRVRERPRALPDLSYSTVALAVGIAAMLNGVAFGLWLVLIGAGLVGLGLGGLAREYLAARRAVK
jgi:hypothetical protein